MTGLHRLGAIIHILWGISALLFAGAILAWAHRYVRRRWSRLCLGLAILFEVLGAAALGCFLDWSGGHWEILGYPPIWIAFALFVAAFVRKRTPGCSNRCNP
jgi:urea transporter